MRRVGGSIRPRRLEAKGQPLVIDDLQSPRRQGWSASVADQAFQAGPIVVDAGGRMQREAAGGEAQGSVANGLGGLQGLGLGGSSIWESSSRPRRCSRRTMRWTAGRFDLSTEGCIMVRKRGLEPRRPKALPPQCKSDRSPNLLAPLYLPGMLPDPLW